MNILPFHNPENEAMKKRNYEKSIMQVFHSLLDLCFSINILLEWADRSVIKKNFFHNYNVIMVTVSNKQTKTRNLQFRDKRELK